MAGKSPRPSAPPAVVSAPDPSALTPADLHWFREGRHYRLYQKLGAHAVPSGGVRFAVWAPNAEQVAVVGDFNAWDRRQYPMKPQGDSGIWESVVPDASVGRLYKYAIRPRGSGMWHEKADPFAFAAELPPRTASQVCDLEYGWHDEAWMRERAGRNSGAAPVSIYELHLGSWMRVPEEHHRSLTYREIAPRLIDHVHRCGFTHVEFLPLMEHPFYGSWGYQVTSYFAPTSRFGTPQDLMFLIDQLHQNNIGVILDWVPSHFPNDPHGLAAFDGTHLYEHADPRQGFHPDWQSCIFNYGRNEVRSFLASSALFWLDRYHADGLRVDAVASMLYLDYSRRPGEWIPNRYGGRENIEAIDFLRRLNEDIYLNYPDVQTIAEESTAWPMVSRPTYVGGLGFGMKWDMGWMHDTLSYFSLDPVFRKFHHSELTFRQLYATQENFVLPLSHDEVVHGKGSLLGRMPGDEWQRFANMRLLYGYMFGQNGKKLLFMGGEFGQVPEWNHEGSLDWHVLQYPVHSGLLRWLSDLNGAYRRYPALHTGDFDANGFRWVDCNDALSSTLSWLRRAGGESVLVVCNFTPVPRPNYRVGVPHGGFWREILNSDAVEYAGSGQGNCGGLLAVDAPHHGLPAHLNMNLPPLAAVFFHFSAA